MKVGEMIEALGNYNPEANLKCGLSVPTMYINTAANLSITGDDPDPQKCTVVRVVSTAPPVQYQSNPVGTENDADSNNSGPVPGS